VDPCLEYCRRNFKTVVPLPAVNQVRNGAFQVSLFWLFWQIAYSSVQSACLTTTTHQASSIQPNPHNSTPHPQPHVTSTRTHTHTHTHVPTPKVMTICKILESILPKESVRGAPPPDKKLLEYHFVFACIWAFGGCMLVDKVRAQALRLHKTASAVQHVLARPPLHPHSRPNPPPLPSTDPPPSITPLHPPR